MITKDIVMNKLRTVMDPELHINIVDLGLIYDVVIKGNEIRVIMTLTTPGCPLAPVIDKLIKKALSELKADSVTIELVWEPAWSVRRMSDEGKLQLGMI
ncbi:metal-sulfur cluster assembly factor [Candidatus Woesebacteria bacterium]|nr:metal-sulfur cluster assembly factor [Candidatus Woesebacteria bacterium]